MLFFHVAFFVFWPQFGEVLGTTMEAKIALGGPKYQGATPFEAFEHPCFLKTASRTALGSILEPPGVEFGGSGVDYCDI